MFYKEDWNSWFNIIFIIIFIIVKTIITFGFLLKGWWAVGVVVFNLKIKMNKRNIFGPLVMIVFSQV